MALLGWVVGEVIWAVFDLRPEVDHATHPGAAEIVLLLYPIGTTVSLLLLSDLGRRGHHGQRQLALDGLIVATSLFVVSWVFVVRKMVTESSSARPVTLSHIFADVVVITTAILTVSRGRPGGRPSLSLLAGGIATIGVADLVVVFQTGIGSYHNGELVDLTRVAGLAMMALAALSSITESRTAALPDEISYRARLWLPYLPLLLAAGVGLGKTLPVVEHAPLAAALGILVAAVLARQLVVLVENQSLLSEVAREAYRDSLTGLANRAHFLRRLEQAVAQRHPGAAPIAVMVLDLDDFKSVNDDLGHPAGDELLVRVAGRLNCVLGETGTVARLGGDEFAVFIEGSVEESLAAAHRVLDAFRAGFVIDGVPLTVRPSIGFTSATAASRCTVDDLLRHADLAMYAAKREGGQCVRSFAAELPFHSASPQQTDVRAENRITVYDPAFELYHDDPYLIEELRTALRDGAQLRCHYQPKINASDGSVHSVEALLRWEHPRRGLLLPQEFLPAAERAGLMRKVAYHAVNIALEQIQSWRARGIPATVAVNLSTTNLLDLDLVGMIQSLLRTHAVPADALIIEITESTLVDSVRSRKTVAALQRLGVRISLDDYGTGWSSLARLQNVSVDELKLDRIFVARLAEDPRSVAIVRSTVALARSLGADLVAEGVEDEITLSALRRYGCTITQGFVHSPPLPANEMEHWMASYAPAPASNESQQAAVTD